jgi:hypothetical protein
VSSQDYTVCSNNAKSCFSSVESAIYGIHTGLIVLSRLDVAVSEDNETVNDKSFGFHSFFEQSKLFVNE